MRHLTIPRLHPKDRTVVAALQTEADENDCHVYMLTGFRHTTNRAYRATEYGGGPNADAIEAAATSPDALHILAFQHGDPATVGVNGITMEAMLAVLADRLQCMQAGPWACAENATALGCILAASDALQSRGRRLKGAHGGEPATAAPDDLRALVRRLIALRPAMSYNESYAGEPAGLVKASVAEWERKGASSDAPPLPTNLSSAGKA